ncbi:MAG: OmpH family outer membrane protein [Flammeovirgaceae bacterium]|nr:OmpH family outer membrane protein [Flammeovirgaceae bacterium]
MRLFILLAVFFASGLNFASAQKFGYIDSDFILAKMPDYAKAQEEIDRLSATWQKEIEEMQKKVEGMYNAFQAEQVLLTEEMKQERLDDLAKKENELKEYQKKVFGFGGLFLKLKRLKLNTF